MARLNAIKAAKEVADQWGFAVTPNLRKQAEDAVNEVLLPPGWEQKHMVDAADYLELRGHSEIEIQYLASEFGKALKTAKELITGTASVTNLQSYGNTTQNAIHMYNSIQEAAFLKTRPLFQKYVQRNPLNDQIASALKGTRGFPTR